MSLLRTRAIAGSMLTAHGRITLGRVGPRPAPPNVSLHYPASTIGRGLLRLSLKLLRQPFVVPTLNPQFPLDRDRLRWKAFDFIAGLVM